MKRLIVVVLLAFALTASAQVPLSGDDEIYRQINARLGTQGYVAVIYKPMSQPPTGNPFKQAPTHKEDWFIYEVEIGSTSTPFGRVALGRGVNLELAFADVKKNHPYMFSQGDK